MRTLLIISIAFIALCDNAFCQRPQAGLLSKIISAISDNINTISATDTAVTYDWDASDRLVKITKGSNITEFVYDGLGRRVAEKLNGAVIKRWLWCGSELCEERSADGTIAIKRFFLQGEQISGTNYYFTRDHLGSIREMTDGNSNSKARYAYDPYGRRKKTSGNMDADFGYTGHYFHQASGLHFTVYRAYDANLGRWLSRDPIEEKGGLNLYGYVNNNPINKIDPIGLDPIVLTSTITDIPMCLPFEIILGPAIIELDIELGLAIIEPEEGDCEEEQDCMDDAKQ